MPPIDRREYLKYTGAASIGPLVGQTARGEQGDARDTDEQSKNDESAEFGGAPTNLRVEYMENPLGVDTAQPRLSWQTTPAHRGQTQTAYRILVASDEKTIKRDYGDKWDTGKVTSSQSTHIAYAGNPLDSNERVYWKVRVWDDNDQPSPWSDSVTWEMGLLEEEKWKADWIGSPRQHDKPTSEKQANRVLDVSGSGVILRSDRNQQSDNRPGVNWTNYTLVADFSVNEIAAGFVFRAQDSQNFYLWQIITDHYSNPETADRNAVLRATTFVNGRFVFLKNTPFALGDEDAQHAIKIEARGEQITTFVDGEQIDTTVDTTHSAGTIGFRQNNSEHALFDNVQVMDSEGEVLFKDDFEHNTVQHFDGGRITTQDTNDDSGDKQAPAPLLRTEFNLKKQVAEATVYISGLGFYELHVNGERIGDQVLDPGRTNYLGTVLYATHDITDTLQQGDNALGVELGRARFGTLIPDIWNWEDAPWWSNPKLRLQLNVEYVDGSTETITSDDTWRVSDGPTRFDTLTTFVPRPRLQEEYDARHERPGWTESAFDVDGWETAISVETPAGELTSQIHQPNKIRKTLTPVNRSNPAEDVYVFDMGQMFPGWPRLAVDGEAGTQVTLATGEQLDGNGRVTAMRHEFRYTLNGEGIEVWHPRFAYSGFRYVEVRGFPGEPTAENIQADVVHDAVDEDVESDFACSDELLTQIHENARWGMLNCLHGGVHEDTPTWEKNGWTEVLIEIGEDMIYNFSMARFYTKRLQDIQDALARSPEVTGEKGELPVVIPSPDWGYGRWTPDPGWTSEFFELVWNMYSYYGDERILEEHYTGLKDHLEYLGRHADRHIIQAGLGDWGSPWIGNAPVVERGDSDTQISRPPEGPAIVSTGHYYRNADLLSRIAAVLGREEEAAEFATLSDQIAEAFNEEFLDTDDVYRTGETPQYRQTSNLYPLAYGIVPEDRAEAVVENLVQDVMVTHDGHPNTGAHGTMLILEVLTEYGYHDVAYTVATQRTYPSWGFWIENDITALLEFWYLNSRSRTHDFLGSCIEWYWQYLAGIREPGEPGFDHVEIAPKLVDGLHWAEATTETPHGSVESRWQQTPYGLELTVTVPGTATGMIRIPDLEADTVRVEERDATIWESGEAARPFPAGIEAVDRTDDAVVVEVGAGTYAFTLTPGDLHIIGSREDDGAIFTDGQTNRVDLEVEAKEPVSVRDQMPDGWTVLDGDSHEVYEADGQRYIEFDGQRQSGKVTYFAEAPSGAQETGRYTFGPIEAAPGPEGEWQSLSGTSDSTVVVGPDTDINSPQVLAGVAVNETPGGPADGDPDITTIVTEQSDSTRTDTSGDPIDETVDTATNSTTGATDDIDDLV